MIFNFLRTLIELIPIDSKIISLVIFVATYISLLVFTNKRMYIALSAGLVFIILGILPIDKIYETLNLNVLLLLLGVMGIVSLFIESRMPAYLGDVIISKMPNVKWTIIALSLFSGLISAFVDNVATVLMVAPIAITICKKLKISPVLSIIAIAISSNLQGAATLIGDTTSILLASEAKMNFFDFFIYNGKLGMFWIIQVSAIATMFFFLFIFRRENAKVESNSFEKVNSYFPTILLVANMILLIITSFIDNKPELTNGLISVVLLVIGLVYKYFKTKDAKSVLNTVKEIDYVTLLILAGIFMIIGGISNVGIIEDIAKLIAKLSSNKIVIYIIVVVISMLLSGVIDNIPYVAAMLPVMTNLAGILNINPALLYFGLIAGATLGGNLTPIGASANIAGLGILKKEGYDVSAKTFMKISVPFTLLAVAVGSILIYIVYC